MSRSIKKGPYIDENLMKKVMAQKKGTDRTVLKTWARASQIAPEFVTHKIGIHNGKKHIEVLITEGMVGHRLGEFSPTRKFTKHGGKMQKELEQKKKEAEIAQAKTATTATTDAKAKK